MNEIRYECAWFGKQWAKSLQRMKRMKTFESKLKSIWMVRRRMGKRVHVLYSVNFIFAKVQTSIVISCCNRIISGDRQHNNNRQLFHFWLFSLIYNTFWTANLIVSLLFFERESAKIKIPTRKQKEINFQNIDRVKCAWMWMPTNKHLNCFRSISLNHRTQASSKGLIAFNKNYFNIFRNERENVNRLLPICEREWTSHHAADDAIRLCLFASHLLCIIYLCV